jgi:hypothetical protein
MTAGRSREDLYSFLDYLAAKGLIPAATARARKASSKQVLAILDADEAADVLALDLDLLMHRFSTKHGQQYNPNSLRDYSSRLRASIDDFRAYTENPLGFRTLSRTRQRTPKSPAPSLSKKANSPNRSEDAPTPAPVPVAPQPSANLLPIRLRADLTIQIAGLPHDLSAAEAKKIANIILAHASDD